MIHATDAHVNPVTLPRGYGSGPDAGNFLLRTFVLELWNTAYIKNAIGVENRTITERPAGSAFGLSSLCLGHYG